MTAAARFKQEDVKRAVAGVLKAGLLPSSIEIEPNGKIVILTSNAPSARSRNPWDDDEAPPVAA